MTNVVKKENILDKVVILRCDLNVPLKNGKIDDDTRIIKSLKTIKFLLKYSRKIIILSHLGRVKTEEDKNDKSLKIVCDKLSELLKMNIAFSKYDEHINDIVKDNKIIMFENTRFFDVEKNLESNCDDDLSKYYASFGEVFVNDAFGTCHRKNASNYGISKYLPSYLGLLIEEEIKMLSLVKDHPKYPFYIIMGGAKISDKITLIEKLIEKSSKIFISGAMAFTFLKVKNYNVGKSFIDEKTLEFCKKILKKYEEKIILPVDYFVGKEFSNNTSRKLKSISEFSDDDIGLDIGEKTLELYKEYLSDAKTIFLNGPVGVFEFEKFSYGTKKLCNILDKLDSTIVVGGGDSASAVKKYSNKITNISTGGGAALEYIEGKKLPGLYIGE